MQNVSAPKREEWVSAGIHEFTGTGKMEGVSIPIVSGWVMNAWGNVKAIFIKNIHLENVALGVLYTLRVGKKMSC